MYTYLSLSIYIYMYVYIYIYIVSIYIYIYIYIGANYCTPEIDTSKLIVDFPWHAPMNVQWHFPT